MNHPLLLALLLFSFTALAQQEMRVDQKTGKIMYDGIGKVTFIKGKVYRTKFSDKKSEEIGLNFPIIKSDIIQTESKSAVKITLNDATVISIGPDSHFNFKNFDYSNKAERNANLELKMGKARVEVPIKVAKGKMKFNTRNVSLGVRGTEFLMSQEIDKNGISKEQIALLKGALSLEDDTGKKVDLTPKDHFLLKRSQNGLIESKVIQLTPKMYELLKAENLSKNTVKPFLTNLDEEKLSGENEQSSETPETSKLRKSKNFWKESLEKLNKKLKKSLD